MKYIDEYLALAEDIYPIDRVSKHLKRLKVTFADVDEEKFDTYTTDDIIKILTEHITTYTQLYNAASDFKRYCMWCVDNKNCSDMILDTLDEIKLSKVWRDNISQSDTVKKKYITNKEYEELIDNIEYHTEYNVLFYKTLVMCIYEGVYDINWETLNNLRATDVDVKNHLVRIRRNNDVFMMDISPELADNLVALSNVKYWERPNRNGICQVKYQDSSDRVFKIEQRSVSSNGKIEPQLYSRRLRKITDEMLGYSIKAQNIYISGIINRIKEMAASEGTTLDELFGYNTRKYRYIIRDELQRIGYNVQYASFMTMVQGIVKHFN